MTLVKEYEDVRDGYYTGSKSDLNIIKALELVDFIRTKPNGKELGNGIVAYMRAAT